MNRAFEVARRPWRMALGAMSIGIVMTQLLAAAAPAQEPASAIAEREIDGVVVRINQLQMQRIGGEVRTPEILTRLQIGGEKFQRTIALVLTQNGQGTTSGPLHITLRNGRVLHPVLDGNSRFMSVLANAETAEGDAFQETWFTVPAEVEFADVFPIQVTFKTTTPDGKPVTFEFDGLTP